MYLIRSHTTQSRIRHRLDDIEIQENDGCNSPYDIRTDHGYRSKWLKFQGYTLLFTKNRTRKVPGSGQPNGCLTQVEDVCFGALEWTVSGYGTTGASTGECLRR